MSELSAEGGTEAIAANVLAKASQVAPAVANVEDIVTQMEGTEWGGIEPLRTAMARAVEGASQLYVIGEVVGVGGAEIRGALSNSVAALAREETVTGKTR